MVPFPPRKSPSSPTQPPLRSGCAPIVRSSACPCGASPSIPVPKHALVEPSRRIWEPSFLRALPSTLAGSREPPATTTRRAPACAQVARSAAPLSTTSFSSASSATTISGCAAMPALPAGARAQRRSAAATSWPTGSWTRMSTAMAFSPSSWAPFSTPAPLPILVCCAVLARVELSASPRAADSPGYWGFDTSNLDKTCKPCDDFFQFAMGGWMKSNPIPPEYSTWGSFTVLADKNQQTLRTILDAAEKSGAPAGSNERKVGDFYASCMDTAALDAAGAKPIDSGLQRIAELKNARELPALAGRLQQQGIGVLFRFTSNQDAKDSTQIIAFALQGGR